MGGSTATSRREPHSDHSRFKALPPYAENQHVNILSLELHLREHPDRSAVNFILEGLRSGFRIGFRGQLSDTSRPNNKSALENSRIVTNAVQKEVAREHTAGPFLSPPFPINHISPLGAVPKKDGTCRIVFDLSQPEGESINDFIFKEEYPCSYTHFDEATELTLLMGRGCFLSKIDIKHAYRLLPVHPRDWPLLVYRWQEHFYVDLKLPFGCRSSASIFTAFADLVCWILRHHYRLTVIHYSDDFLIVTGPDRALAQKHQDTFKEVFWRLWIPCADDKTVGPSTKLPFLGISISTTDFTLSIPEKKVNDILQELPRWCARKTCTKRELESLHGRLNFFSKVIVPGRLFVRRLIELSTTVRHRNHHITMNKQAREDIHWWCEFLHSWNRSSYIPETKWIHSTDLLLFTDAAKGFGLGAVYKSAWIQSGWDDTRAAMSIDYLELFAIFAAIITWGYQWRGKRIVMITDNESITQIWAKGSSSKPELMTLVRRIFMFAAANSFTVSFKHIPGKTNKAADALSRFQMQRFRQLMPGADVNPTKIPANVWDVNVHLH